MGRLDNELKEMTTGTTAWDIVVKIHNVHVETAAKHISDKAKKKILDHEFQEIFKGVSGQYTKNTFGSLRVLGSKTGKLWDNIHKLFGIPVKRRYQKARVNRLLPLLVIFIIWQTFLKPNLSSGPTGSFNTLTRGIHLCSKNVVIHTRRNRG